MRLSRMEVGSVRMTMEFTSSCKMAAPLLDVYLLGELEFERALRLQSRLVYDVSGSDGQLAALVLCEHRGVITIGRQGSRAHIACGDDELAALGLTLRWVNRGGGCVLHRPGQLVVYPVMPVSPESLKPADYVRRLAECVANVLAEFNIKCSISADLSGVYVRGAQIATIGVAVSRWVAYHGLTLNVSGWTKPFEVIHPSGNGALIATTMEAERRRPIKMAQVRECLVRQFVQTFHIPRYHIFTWHPILMAEEPRYAVASAVRC